MNKTFKPLLLFKTPDVLNEIVATRSMLIQDKVSLDQMMRAVLTIAVEHGLDKTWADDIYSVLSLDVEDPDIPRVFNTQQVCDILGINRNTLYSLIRSGDIPARKVGKGYRILASVIEQWLKSVTKRSLDG